jgi:hypothetical protein
MNITHPLKMTLDRYDHPVRGPLNVCVLLCNPPTIPWVRGPLARVVRCGAGITPTTNEGHSPPLEREVKRLRPIVRSPPHHHLGARASGPPCAVWGVSPCKSARNAVTGLRPALCSVGLALPPTNEGHSPPLEWESVHPNDATPAQSPMGYGRLVNRPF